MDDKRFEGVRVGIVSSVDIKMCTARVIFPDRDEDVSYNYPVLVRNTMVSKDYWLPEVNEQVVCLCLANGAETGFIVGSFYSERDKTPPQMWKREQPRRGLWINEKNYIEWVEEDRQFIVRTENPIRFEVDPNWPDYEDDKDRGNWPVPYDPHEEG